MVSLDGMITVAEAARRLGRSLEQVRRYLREGKLKGQRIGGQWFVEEASLGLVATLLKPLPLAKATSLTNQEAMISAFHLDLRDIEAIFTAELRVWPTTADDQQRGYPPGVTISTDRKGHGAELHLTWDHVQALRNELDRLLREAKQLDP
jgi:excisionase family DNA binding protein